MADEVFQGSSKAAELLPGVARSQFKRIFPPPSNQVQDHPSLAERQRYYQITAQN
jgi:hypothetical protein